VPFDENAAVILRYFEIAESGHELQNPTSKEKVLLLGEPLGLRPGSRVLDIASGRGGPALVLAQAFGCTIEGIEIRPEFHAAAVERVAETGLEALVDFRLADASRETLPESYDAALCLGASFVWGGLAGTLDALEPVVRPGGHVVVGEPYWRRLPLPDEYEDRNEPFTDLKGTVDIFESGALETVSVIASSEDDWDRYETLHWSALEHWLAANPDDPDADEIRSRYLREKRKYLRYQRDHLGWAIFVGRKP
jgi:cyclopropane fatty-acyl-phospholipid synthase-like methyltransferase